MKPAGFAAAFPLTGRDLRRIAKRVGVDGPVEIFPPAGKFNPLAYPFCVCQRLIRLIHRIHRVRVGFADIVARARAEVARLAGA